MNQRPEDFEKHRALAKERVAVAVSLERALTGAGYKLYTYKDGGGAANRVPYTVPTEVPTTEGVWFVVRKDGVDFEVPVSIMPEASSVFGRLAYSRNLVRLGPRFNRSSRRYTKFTGLEAKTKNYVDGQFEIAKNLAASRAIVNKADAFWSAVKEREIGSLVPPPGVRFDIISLTDITPGTPGTYKVRFNGGVPPLQLTAEQVEKLNALLSEIVGATSAYIVRVFDKDREVTYYADARGGFTSNLDNVQLLSQPATEAELEAKRKRMSDYNIAGDLEVVTYQEAYLSARKSAAT